MKRIIFRAPTLTHSGYGVHARQIARWLLNKKDVDVRFQVLPWGDTPWLLDKDRHDGLIGKIIERSIDASSAHGDVSIQLQLPNEWDPTIAPVNIGVTAGVETDRCNPSWITNCNSMSRLIVPSKHVMSTFMNTGNVDVPMSIVPEAYMPAIDDHHGVKMPQFSTPFNFLIFGQLTGNNPFNDRKNTFFTLKWLCETFKDDKDVGIVIKTNAGHNTKIDRNVVVNVLKGVIKEARVGEFPRIHLLHGDMDDNAVVSLYKHSQIQALVTLTRGEGYGLPILEAATCGLPIIATGWSGHLDFLKYGKYVDIYYKLVDIHSSRIDNKIFLKGMKWAEPSEEEFKKRVLKFRYNNKIPHEWANSLANELKTRFNQKAIEARYDEALKDVL
jgi:glycosyltransferase involved in cell wall biosynthesis